MGGDPLEGLRRQRNRRLIEFMLKEATWVPGGIARASLGISARRLARLIRERILEAEAFISNAGRNFVMIRTESLEVARRILSSGMDLLAAADALGFTKRRMRTLVRVLFINATKPDDAPTARWFIPRADVDAILDLAEGVPYVGIPDEGCVSIIHILRYWAWKSNDIGDLLLAAKRGEMMPLARVDGAKGVSGLVFQEAALKLWYDHKSRGAGQWISIPQFAKEYSLSEETVYEPKSGSCLCGRRSTGVIWEARRRRGFA